jgi:hypothetical protein
MKTKILAIAILLSPFFALAQTNYTYVLNDTNFPVVQTDFAEANGANLTYFEYGLSFGISLGGIAFTWRVIRLLGVKNHSSKSI